MGITVTDNTASGSSFITRNRPLSKKEIRSKFLVDFKSRIDDETDRLYLFYGRPYEFTDDSPAGDVPPAPIDSQLDDSNTRKAFIALRKIRADDVIQAFKKKLWTSGRSYDAYSNDADLSDKDYYVFTDENQLFICLDNNSQLDGTTRNSTIKPSRPTGDGEPFTESDGYKWKLLIDFEDSRLRKFSADSHLPLPPQSSSEIKPSEFGGQVDRLVLDTDSADSPHGYSYDSILNSPESLNSPQSIQEIPLFIKGDGDSVRTAIADIDTVSGGAITGLTVSTPGSGYYNDPIRSTVPVQLIRRGLAQSPADYAYGIATISGGTVSSVEIKNGGDNFSNTDTVTIVQSSAIAYAKVDTSTGLLINSATIKPFEILDKKEGKNFKIASVVSVVEGGAVLPDNNIKVVLSPASGHGSNIKTELSSTSLFINVKITSGITQFSNSNDFRQIGLILNPLDTNSTAINTDFVDATKSIIVEASGSASLVNIGEDDNIDGVTNFHRGRVVDTLAVTNQPAQKEIRYLDDPEFSTSSDDSPQTIGVFSVNENVKITSDSSNDGYTVKSIKSKTPEIDIFSGEILFINNSNKIDRAAEQSETLNFIFNF